jgi:O-antigen/teichoic acid export membrane protein
LRDYFNNIARNSTVYFFAGIVTRAFGFLLLPVFTRYLTPEEFGIYNFVEIIVNLGITVFTLGLIAAATRFYFDFKQKSDEQKRYLGRIYFFILLVALFMSGVFILFGRRPIEAVFQGLPFYPYAVMAFIICFFRISYRYKLNIYRLEQSSVRYSVLNSVFFLLKLAGILLALMVLKKSLIGVVWSDLIVTVLFAIISMILLRKDIQADFSFRYMIAPLKYSVPLIPHDLSGFVLTTVDRMLIAGILTMYDVGIYSLAVKISMVMIMLMEAVRMAYNPLFFKKATEDPEGSKPFFAKFFTHIILLYVLIGLGIILFNREIITIFASREYYDAGIVLPVIIFSQIIQGVYYLSVVPLFLKKRATYLVTVATLTSSVINIFLNIWLIKAYHITGAAWATCISIFISVILTFIFSQGKFRIPYEYKRVLIVFLLFGGGVAINYFYISTVDSLLPAVLLKTATLALFIILLIPLKFFSKSEQQYLLFIAGKFGLIKKNKHDAF